MENLSILLPLERNPGVMGWNCMAEPQSHHTPVLYEAIAEEDGCAELPYSGCGYAACFA